MIRGVTEGELSASRLGLNIRDEYRIGGRAFVFGQNQYLRDAFKKIVFLLAPTGGIGYKVLDTDRTKFSLDAGIGGVWEKNTDMDVRASGAVTLGERYSHALTPAATLTQSFSGLWKTSDFADSLLTFGVGIAVSMSTQTQLKVELLDSYKNRPPVSSVQKNDVAVLMAIVYKVWATDRDRVEFQFPRRCRDGYPTPSHWRIGGASAGG